MVNYPNYPLSLSPGSSWSQHWSNQRTPRQVHTTSYKLATTWLHLTTSSSIPLALSFSNRPFIFPDVFFIFSISRKIHLSISIYGGNLGYPHLTNSQPPSSQRQTEHRSYPPVFKNGHGKSTIYGWFYRCLSSIEAWDFPDCHVWLQDVIAPATSHSHSIPVELDRWKPISNTSWTVRVCHHINFIPWLSMVFILRSVDYPLFYP